MENCENILAATDAERTEKTFLLHWLGQNEPEEIKGENITRAFTAAGYGAGAIRALDWYEEWYEEIEHKENKNA